VDEGRKPQQAADEEAAHDAEPGADRQPPEQRAELAEYAQRIGGERDLQDEHGEQCADRVDEHSLGLEDGLQPRLKAEVSHERAHDRGTRDHDERTEEERQRPGPSEPVARREGASRERDECADRDEPADHPLLAAQALPLQVQRPFEEDDRDAEIDQDEQAEPEIARMHPVKPLRSERDPRRQEEDDRRHPDRAGDDLDGHARRERQRDGQRNVV
jgi:hypothetical protein